MHLSLPGEVDFFRNGRELPIFTISLMRMNKRLQYLILN
jgi:hypothetical protein